MIQVVWWHKQNFPSWLIHLSKHMVTTSLSVSVTNIKDRYWDLDVFCVDVFIISCVIMCKLVFFSSFSSPLLSSFIPHALWPVQLLFHCEYLHLHHVSVCMHTHSDMLYSPGTKSRSSLSEDEQGDTFTPTTTFTPVTNLHVVTSQCISKGVVTM